MNLYAEDLNIIVNILDAVNGVNLGQAIGAPYAFPIENAEGDLLGYAVNEVGVYSFALVDTKMASHAEMVLEGKVK